MIVIVHILFFVGVFFGGWSALSYPRSKREWREILEAFENRKGRG